MASFNEPISKGRVEIKTKTEPVSPAVSRALIATIVAVFWGVVAFGCAVWLGWNARVVIATFVVVWVVVWGALCGLELAAG